jgi:hypothetical protein
MNPGDCVWEHRMQIGADELIESKVPSDKSLHLNFMPWPQSSGQYEDWGELIISTATPQFSSTATAGRKEVRGAAIRSSRLAPGRRGLSWITRPKSRKWHCKGQAPKFFSASAAWETFHHLSKRKMFLARTCPHAVYPPAVKDGNQGKTLIAGEKSLNIEQGITCQRNTVIQLVPKPQSSSDIPHREPLASMFFADGSRKVNWLNYLTLIVFAICCSY